jgi:hypothetical protein
MIFRNTKYEQKLCHPILQSLLIILIVKELSGNPGRRERAV